MDKNRWKHKKWIIYFLVFLMAITAIRLAWMSFLTTLEYSEQIFVKQGKVDFRGWNFTNDQTIPIDGGWEFYPNAFISPEKFAQNEVEGNFTKEIVQVPSTLDKVFERENNEKTSESSESKTTLINQHDDTFRYGTYRLRILLDEPVDRTFGIRINEIRNASAVYVNSQLIASAGEVASEKDEHQARNIPYTVVATSDDNEIDLVIHVSSHDKNAGITKSIHFGTIEAINKRTALSVGSQILVTGVLLFHSFYAFILYFLGSKSKVLRYFSLFIFSAMLSVLVVDDKILFTTFYIEYEWYIKIIYFSYIGVAAFLPHVMKSLFTPYANQKIIRFFSAFCALYVLFVLFSPFTFIIKVSPLLLPICLIVSVLITIQILYKALIGNKDVIFILIACLSIGVNVLWSISQELLGIERMHYPFDLIFAVLAFSAFWFQRFFKATNETRQLAEKLQLEDKRKDVFLINTSHELRNPLYGLTNLTQSILDDRRDEISDNHRNRLEILLKISNHMAFMLDDLVDFTRLKENRIRLRKKNVKVQSILFGITDMIRLMLEGKPIQLNVEIPHDLPAVRADENRLIQILYNLMHNAVKYTNDGTITVRAQTKGDMVQFQVEDTGIGIDEKSLQKIFNMYEQAENNHTRASGGFGLGLNICQQLVQLHGGTIEVQSKVGKGTTFTFTIPQFTDDITEESLVEQDASEKEILVENDNKWREDYFVKRNTMDELTKNNDQTMLNNEQAKHYEDQIAASSEPISRTPLEQADSNEYKPRILIVDDESINLQTIMHLLGPDDYDITTVTSAESVITLLEKQPFDLVISDVMMPNISGYELTRLIRERYSMSELPVLLLTARERPTDTLTGFQVGANDYVKKPIDGQELKARVRALTELKISVDERLRMESAWMQSQIQPHFLYNTLNSIAALSVVDNEKMQSLLEQFSNYLRLSFDFKNTDPVITLEHELMLVRSYLYIEKVRFGERLQINWEINANINVKLPPLTIQPLVENSVRHGVMQRKNGGSICIRVDETKELLKVCVFDDGVGIPEEKIKTLLLQENYSNKERGVGLQNVHNRLKQFYGEGLQIQSVVNEGTTVSFQVPLKKNR